VEWLDAIAERFYAEHIGDDATAQMVLEAAFYWGQNDHQAKEQPSVSVGDIALLWGKRYLCSTFGWKELSDEAYAAYIAADRQVRVLTALDINTDLEGDHRHGIPPVVENGGGVG